MKGLASIKRHDCVFNRSHKCSYAGRVIGEAEFFRSTVLLLLEDAVEVRHVIKSAAVSNFINALRSIDQHT